MIAVATQIEILKNGSSNQGTYLTILMLLTKKNNITLKS